MGYELYGVLLSREEQRHQDQARMREVLRPHGFPNMPGDGHFKVEFPEEMTYVSFDAAELNEGRPLEGCMFRVGGVGPQQSEFIYEFSKAADFALVIIGDGDTLVLTSDNQLGTVPDDILKAFPQNIVCKSSQELWELLDGGFERYYVERERVWGKPQE